jgi:hypothetical protein
MSWGISVSNCWSAASSVRAGMIIATFSVVFTLKLLKNAVLLYTRLKGATIYTTEADYFHEKPLIIR